MGTHSRSQRHLREVIGVDSDGQTYQGSGLDLTAPTIFTPPAFSQPENSPFVVTLTASEPVTWSFAGGADVALFGLIGNQLTMNARNYEAPVDQGSNNTYVVNVLATDVAGNQRVKAITVTILDVDEIPPTITSGNSPHVYSLTQLDWPLTANEPVTWSFVGGADVAFFFLTGNILTLPAKDYYAPVDAGSNNTYIVTIRATDTAGNQTNQTITVTIDAPLVVAGGALKFNAAANSGWLAALEDI